jgi:hypothetical protein
MTALNRIAVAARATYMFAPNIGRHIARQANLG